MRVCYRKRSKLHQLAMLGFGSEHSSGTAVLYLLPSEIVLFWRGNELSRGPNLNDTKYGY
jgi:hypothetical protein